MPTPIRPKISYSIFEKKKKTTSRMLTSVKMSLLTNFFYFDWILNKIMNKELFEGKTDIKLSF